MKSNSSTVALRYFVNSVFLTVVSFIILNTAAAQTTNKPVSKPKAILVAEWTNSPKALNQDKILPAQSYERARFASKLESNALASSPAKQFAVVATENEFAERFASLKPTTLEEQAFVLINEQRLAQHLQLLEWDLTMLYLAREHSENMAQLNFFSHLGRDGKMVDERANDVNIRDWRAIGENIAFTQGVKNSVESIIQNWMNSPHHKENLLDKKWTRSGIGIIQTSEGKFYITQVFRD